MLLKMEHQMDTGRCSWCTERAHYRIRIPPRDISVQPAILCYPILDVGARTGLRRVPKGLTVHGVSFFLVGAAAAEKFHCTPDITICALQRSQRIASAISHRDKCLLTFCQAVWVWTARKSNRARF